MGIIFVVKLAVFPVFCARSAESHWQCQVTMLVPHVVLAVLRPPWPVPGQGGRGTGRCLSLHVGAHSLGLARIRA